MGLANTIFDVVFNFYLAERGISEGDAGVIYAVATGAMAVAVVPLLLLLSFVAACLMLLLRLPSARGPAPGGEVGAGPGRGGGREAQLRHPLRRLGLPGRVDRAVLPLRERPVRPDLRHLGERHLADPGHRQDRQHLRRRLRAGPGQEVLAAPWSAPWR
ncbi:hypothetical protein [Streptomyces sp. NPDC086147]|uniref:hypothetical protein n=1 Tax=Streptomyces sp. NPDC086147 TaxID=3155295 RepID=UPI003451117B